MDMLHIVGKWKVTITKDDPDHTKVEFAVYGDHIQNVLREVANLDFGDVLNITINKVLFPSMNTTGTNIPTTA